jgi:hypothetical protein
VKTPLFIFAFFFWLACTRAADFFWVDAKINGKNARLILDTGCPRNTVCLFRPGAERLGLKLDLAESPDSGAGPWWTSAESTLSVRWSFWNCFRARGKLSVIELPPFVSKDLEAADGAIGLGVIGTRMIELDAAQRRYRFLQRAPKEEAGWTRFNIMTNFDILVLERPDSREGRDVIIVDTGMQGGGVSLDTERWHLWKTAHPDQQVTLRFGFLPDAGVFVRECAWAEKLSLGPLELDGVTVEEADPLTSKIAAKGHAASFGLAAVNRLDFIVDCKHNVAYLRPRKTPPPPSDPARRSLAFVPRDGRSGDLVARVVDGSPAYNAGVRNGDALLKVDDRDLAAWRASPGDGWLINPRTSFAVLTTSSLAKGGLKLTVKRGDETFRANVSPGSIAIFAAQPWTNSPSGSK